MKTIRILLLLLFSSLLAEAHDFTLNQGYVDHKGFLVNIPYEGKRDLPIIEVTIGQKIHRFLLDTGAPTIIVRSIYRKGRFQKLGSVPSYDINDRQEQMPAVKIPELQIGSLTVNDIPAIVAADDNPVFRYLDVEGVIGSNLLRGMIVQISSTNHTVIFTDDVSRLELGSCFEAAMSTDKDIQSSPVIKISIGKGITEELLFDTGFDGFYKMSAEKMELFRGNEDLSIQGEVRGGAVYGMFGEEEETIPRHKVMIPEYSLGGYIFRDVIAYTSAGRNSRLGAGLLKTGDVILDYIHQRFYFRPYDPASDVSMRAFTEAYYCGK